MKELNLKKYQTLSEIIRLNIDTIDACAYIPDRKFAEELIEQCKGEINNAQIMLDELS